MVIRQINIALLAGLFAAACAHPPSASTVVDEQLDPQAAAFFAASDPPGDPNAAAIGLRGLGAPLGSDFMQYGRERVDRWESDPDPVSIVWEPEKVDCWLYIDDSTISAEDNARCAALEGDIVKNLRDNALVLDRYRAVQHLPGSPLRAARGTLLIQMVKLTDIDMTLDSRHGRHGEALGKWVTHHSFLQRMSGAAESWVGAAICQVNENLDLATLESLLWRAPTISDEQADRILDVLRPSTMARYPIANLMRSGYKGVRYFYENSPDKEFLAPRYITNRYYRYAQHVIDSAEMPMEFINDFDLGPGDASFWPSRQFLERQLHFHSVEIIKSMHRSNRWMRLLTMKVRIMKEKVSHDRVPEYVAVHGDELQDPVTGFPVRWDSKRGVIYFETTEPWESVRL